MTKTKRLSGTPQTLANLQGFHRPQRDHWVRLAFTQKHAGKTQAAVDSLKAALAEDPGQFSLWAILGSLLHEKLGKFEDAEHCYKEALKIAPDYEWVQHRLAALQLGDPPEGPAALDYNLQSKNSLKLDFPSPNAPSLESPFSLQDTAIAQDNLPLDYLSPLEDKGQTKEDDTGFAPEALARHHLDSGAPELAEDILRQAVNADPQDAFNWANLGRLYHMSLGKLRDAEEAFESALTIEKEDATIWHSYAELLFRGQSRLQEAEKAYLNAIDLDSDNPAYWIDFGELLIEQRRIAEARRAFGHALEKDNKATLAWLHLGQIYWVEFGRLEAAKQAFEKAIQVNPEDRLAYHALAAYLEGVNQFTNARQCYEDLLARFPDDGEGWVLYAQLLLDRFNEKDKAMQAFDKALQHGADQAWCLTQKANIISEPLFTEGNDPSSSNILDEPLYARAEAFLQKALEERPEAGFAQISLARLLIEKQKKVDEQTAHALHRRIIQLYRDSLLHSDPPAAPALELARYLLIQCQDADAAETFLTKLAAQYQEDWPLEIQASIFLDVGNQQDRAERTLRTLYEKFPADGWVLERLTDLMIEDGRFEEADMLLLERLKASPKDDTALYQRGHLFETKGDWEQAANMFRQVADLSPEEVMAWYRLAESLAQREGCQDSALESFEQAFILEPTAAWLWCRYGRFLGRILHRWEDSEAALRMAIHYEATYAHAYIELGHLLWKQKSDYTQAMALLEHAIQLEPTLGAAWFELAHMLETGQSEYQAAEEAYRKAASLDPNNRQISVRLARTVARQDGKIEDGIHLLRGYLKDHPDDGWAWSVLIHIAYDVAHDRQRAIATGREALQRLTANTPDCHLVLQTLAGIIGETLTSLDTALRILEDQPFE